MYSLCHNTKTEFEALKILTAEFALACAKAGDARSFSSQQLRELQLHKNRVEQKRDALEKKLANTFWKRTIDEVLAIDIYGTETNPAKTMQEILLDSSVRQIIFDEIDFDAKRAWMYGGDARATIVSYYAAVRVGSLNERQIEILRKKIEDPLCVKMIREDMESRMKGGDKMIRVQDFVLSLEAIIGLELSERSERETYVTHASTNVFQEAVADVILDGVGRGSNARGKDVIEYETARNSLWCFAAAERVGLLDQVQCKKIRNALERDVFSTIILNDLCGKAISLLGGNTPEYSIDIIRTINALSTINDSLYPVMHERQKGKRTPSL